MEPDLDILAERVDELIETVHRLRRDNQSLKEREQALNAERDRLKEKNLEAKQRLESIINRLRQSGGESS